MPFTFAHPIAVYPFRLLPARYLSITGLIIGSVIPDFEYFLRLKVSSIHSHTLAGLFYYDLPLAVIMTFIFHLIIRDILFANLPEYFRSRLLTISRIDWLAYFRKKWLIVTLSIIMGAGTHLLWDAFTHEHGYFVSIFSLLKTEISVGKQLIPVYKILQHSSTILGISCMFYLFNRIKPVINISRHRIANYWLVVLLFSILFFFFFYMIIGGLAFGNTIVRSISSFMLSLVISSLIYKADNNRYQNI